MNALILLRHSLTLANERHLYGGRTDSPLTERGRRLAVETRQAHPLPRAALYVSSGMRRADETLFLLTGNRPHVTLPGLREMDFGAFELRGYEELKDDDDYRRWIRDARGDTPCPGGECSNAFRARVLEAGDVLLRRPEPTAIVVCHGGTIVYLMQAWFPQTGRSFYEWQPAACRGYRISVDRGRPSGFEEV